MHKVYLGLGTNIGNLSANIVHALKQIEERIGTVVSQSSLYSTEPWGFESENVFLNAAVEIETSLTPCELLSQLIVIERQLGRKEKSIDGCYHDRIIDLDILLYDDEIIDLPELCVPHPLMHERLFVMDPLSEIAPSLRHPQLGLTMKEITDGLHQAQEG